MSALLFCGALLIVTQAPAQRGARAPAPSVKHDTIYVAVQSPPPTVLVQAQSRETFSSLAQAIVGIGLLVFAAVQVLLQIRERRDRQRSAYAALYAEYWRVNALAMDWTGQNLVAAAQAQALYPDMLVPRDWGTMIRLLGDISSATGALGGFAYALVNNAVTSARHLLALAPLPGAGAQMQTLELDCKDALNEAVLTLEDALRAAPSWLGRHKFTLVDPRSKAGKALEQHLLALQGRLAPRRHEPRFGFVGRYLGTWLAKIARWFDPAA